MLTEAGCIGCHEMLIACMLISDRFKVRAVGSVTVSIILML